jgi:hypothetical protein
LNGPSVAQSGQTMVDGLYGGSNTLAKEFSQVVERIKLLGFNGVRCWGSIVSGVRVQWCQVSGFDGVRCWGSMVSGEDCSTRQSCNPKYSTLNCKCL